MGSDGTIEEIKQRLDIVEIVGDYLPLKKAGVSYKGCCPFHQEKTPSFFVNPERQIYHCFGCGEGGDIFEFVMKMDGLDFVEAKELLAAKAGVKIEKWRGGDDNRSEKHRLREANMLAAKMFNHLLMKDERAAVAREYVKKRALSDATIEEFLLGYSLDSWDATSKFLMQKGFTEQEIFKSGLSIKSDRGTGYYDRFRGRLMFPIRDIQGEVVGFTARLMPGPDGKDPDGPKYINTPQTLVYDKSRALYGINLAKQAIRSEKAAVVVEGNMDVVSSHQAGVKNVVASSGTAMTGDQCDILKRFAERLILSFDNDEAGETAAKRGIDTAVAAGFSVRILRLPEGAGKDPDDCVRKDVELWKGAIVDAVAYMNWYIELAQQRTDFSDGESKRRAADSLLREVAKIPNSVERAHWIGELSKLFGTPDSMLYEALKKLDQTAKYSAPIPENTSNQPNNPPLIKKDRHVLVSEYVLGLMFNWPSDIEPYLNELNDNIWAADGGLYSLFKEYYNTFVEGGDSAPNFRTWLASRDNHNDARRAAVLELQAEQEFGELATDKRQAELGKLFGELKKLHERRLRFELIRIMKAEQNQDSQEKIREIQEQLKEVTG